MVLVTYVGLKHGVNPDVPSPPCKLSLLDKSGAPPTVIRRSAPETARPSSRALPGSCVALTGRFTTESAGPR
jgi:hypothetical protein